MGKVSIKTICDFLKENNSFTLLTHSQPDGDTIGSAYGLGYALKDMGKKVKIICADHIPSKFAYITGPFNNDNAGGTVIALDVGDPVLLGSIYEEYANKVELCIDHHISNKNFAKINYADATASATCEIVFEILEQLGVKFTKHILDSLFTGIVTDTGCFKYSNATSKTHIIAAKLIDLGANSAEINRLMFDTKSIQRVKIEAAVMSNMEFFYKGRVALVVLTKKMIDDYGCSTSDLDGINALSRVVEGVMVGITVREKDDGTYKVSVRTNAPINASAICSNFGGGGHKRAAGCQFNTSVNKAKESLLATVKTVLEESGCLI